MRLSHKIKGILAAADLTYAELASLCGLTRQTIHQYLNNPAVDLEELEKGVKVIDVSNIIMQHTVGEILPLIKGLAKEERLKRLKELMIQ